MPLILVRHDDPDYKVELVRWQHWPHGRSGFSGFWGYTQTMLDNHHTPALFPDSVWITKQQITMADQTSKKVTEEPDEVPKGAEREVLPTTHSLKETPTSEPNNDVSAGMDQLSGSGLVGTDLSGRRNDSEK